ncbi:SGS domain containing protein [Histomonas meleagridis]|uniref:SGS domain containing protein n=1 Tax=Histomonas meleagridis TaxID=135588 RepID=UPI00355A5910|nr:SGS domain containing protein [Histomonas meleagridis]KAH0799714.1 SGS domain containing protein [Histomonas meleagridis]
MSSENEFSLNTDAYQMTNSVTVVIYIRNHEVSNLVLHPEEKSLTIELDVDGKKQIKAWAFFDKVLPDSAKVDQGRIKIEITLTKEKPQQWKNALADEQVTKPLYERWKTVKFEEEEEKGEGFEHFIQKMYKDASDDTKRALMKSYIESKGTVLSGDWNDVGSRYVEPVPPK